MFRRRSSNSSLKAISGNYLKRLSPRIMADIKNEYEDINVKQDNFLCPIHNKPCFDFPEFNSIEESLKRFVIHDFAIAIREKQVDICRKKIEVYQEFIPKFDILGDRVQVRTEKQI